MLSRLRFSRLVSILLLCASCGRPELRQAAVSPHVLLLTVDTLRSDHLGSTAYPLPTTPYLDELLSAGVRFPNALAPVPRTTPSLASVLTGAYPHTTGVRTLYDRLGEGVVSVTERLRAAGYTTVAVVSNHVLVPERGLDRGFDVYDFADDTRQAAETTDAALAHVAGRSGGPLFLWVHYIDPHVPYFPAPELAGAFDPDYEGRYRSSFGTVRGGLGDLAYPVDLPKREAVYRNRLPERVNEHVRSLYAADVRSTDDQIRRLVEGLASRLGGDWLIVFTADHGESLGEHDVFYDHGDYVYNAELRVPLGIVLPEGHRLRRAGRVEEWVSLVDVAPTLLDLLDLPPVPEAQLGGRSLVPLLEGPEDVESGSRRTAPYPVFAESGMSFFPDLVRRRVDFTVAGRFRTVVLGDWKLIWTPGLEGEDAFELYDLRHDPAETVDLHATRPAEADQLRALLFAWLRTEASSPTPLSEEDEKRLRSLGYITD